MYYKASELSDINNSKCSCAKGLTAHCYYKGIGVEKNERMAFDIVNKTAMSKGKDSHDHIALLYSYFALNNIKGFDLITALSLFDTIESHANNLYIIMTLKRIYKKLGRKLDVKRMEKMEKNASEVTGELNMSYLRKYIKKFNDFYPILTFTL